jgi:prepilin signal peptidase PulO-like enzyme (type II secretory pathway)
MFTLKKLLTPAGALATLGSLWLPWADVRCSQVHSTPTYWQLAEYDHRLYALAALVGVVGACSLWYLIKRRRVAALCAALGAGLAVAAWAYLGLKRDELAAYQAQLATGGGDLGRLLQDLQVQTGSGFGLYLAGALLALAGALSACLERRTSDSTG